MIERGGKGEGEVGWLGLLPLEERYRRGVWRGAVTKSVGRKLRTNGRMVHHVDEGRAEGCACESRGRGRRGGRSSR